jgi:hypothetical protein
MRKITILEVLDRSSGQFVPIRQAINQGLFNAHTYLFFDPVERCHYSISEASERGLFRAAIEQQGSSSVDAPPPNADNSSSAALIIERTKLFQTVYLLSARDPENKSQLVPIREAIERQLVDVARRVYRDTLVGRDVDFNEAIDKGLITVKVAREMTERITETLTEQKAGEHSLGLVKRTETSSQSNLSTPNGGGGGGGQSAGVAIDISTDNDLENDAYAHAEINSDEVASFNERGNFSFFAEFI